MDRSLADSPVDRLARFTADLRFEALPQDVVSKAKVHIADTLGAGLAGSRSSEFAIARRLIRSPGPVKLWGTGETATARDAALVNGVAAHAFELDDSGGCDHSGAVVVPAVLAALCERETPASGRELIAGVVAGYDVGRRLLEAAGGYDSHNGLGWHSTGTCGALAAAGAVANILTLDAMATRDAITLATSFSSGLWAFIHDGSQAKKIHAGRAAEGGLLAAILAGQGFAGPSKVFDNVWGGFFNAYNKSACQPELLAEELGDIWKIDRAVLKPYASCRGAHSAVDALQDILTETGRNAADITRIELAMSGMLNDMCGAKAAGAMAPTQMSLPYALAARAVFGTAGLKAYSEDCRRDSRVGAMMDAIAVSVDANMAAMDEPLVTLTFKDGARFERMVPRATGSTERPMTPAAIEAKFRELAAMALAEDQVDGLWNLLDNLENLDDCRKIDTYLSGHADRMPSFR